MVKKLSKMIEFYFHDYNIVLYYAFANFTHLKIYNKFLQKLYHLY